MMRAAHRWVLEQVYARVRAAGFEDLGRLHVGMFRYPTPDGLRPTELAEQLEITKQLVNYLLGDMEERGYLVRVPDPTDRRARVVRLTPRGDNLEKTAADAAQSAELAIAELLGPCGFAQFRDSLEKLVSHISKGDLSIGSSAGQQTESARHPLTRTPNKDQGAPMRRSGQDRGATPRDDLP